jgi:hypothetical protein
MIQKQFATHAKNIMESDDNVIGLAAAGSWITDELDEFSDLDLILVTRQKISDDKTMMLDYAKRLGNLLSGFTGEHVGEPRVLICLYDNPLLHVDIKFLTLAEFDKRIETPILLLDKEQQLETIINHSMAKFPYPDFQWIEDRVWTWVHYMLAKIGRKEYFEAYDAFGLLRMYILGPLLHMKNGSLPRGVRKVETVLPAGDLEDLKNTMPVYERRSLLDSLQNSVSLYRKLRIILFDKKVQLHQKTEEIVMEYFKEIEKRE